MDTYIGIKGSVHYKLFDESGNIKLDRTIPNTIVDVGKTFITQRTFLWPGNLSFPAKMTYMAIGTSNVATSTEITKLNGDISSSSNWTTQAINFSTSTPPTAFTGSTGMKITDITVSKETFDIDPLYEPYLHTGAAVLYTRLDGYASNGDVNNTGQFSDRVYVGRVNEDEKWAFFASREDAYLGATSLRLDLTALATAADQYIKKIEWPYVVKASDLSAINSDLVFKSSFTNPDTTTYAIKEAGVFNEQYNPPTVNGTMLCRTVFPAVNVEQNNRLDIEWTLSFADSDTSS